MKISIGVICYNHERFLSQCLDSLLGQTLKPNEIIIADDCSTDQSWELIQSYQDRYPWIIKAYQSTRNRGPFHTGAIVEAHLSGDYVCMMDGDDFWLLEKIEAECRALKEHNADIAHSDVLMVNQKNDVIGAWTKRPEIQTAGDLFVNVMGRRFFSESESVYRNELISRKVFASDGWADGELKNFWDWERKIRYACKYRSVHSNKKLVAYRIHQHGISQAQTSKEIFEAMVRVYEKHQHLLGLRTIKEQFFVRASFEIKAAVQRERLKLIGYPQYSFTSVFLRLYRLLCEMSRDEREQMFQGFAYELLAVLAKNLNNNARIQLFNAFSREINQVKSSIQKAVADGC